MQLTPPALGNSSSGVEGTTAFDDDIDAGDSVQTESQDALCVTWDEPEDESVEEICEL